MGSSYEGQPVDPSYKGQPVGPSHQGKPIGPSYMVHRWTFPAKLTPFISAAAITVYLM